MGVYGRSCEPPDRAGPSSPPHPETVQSEDLNQRRQLVNLAVAFSQRALSPFTARPTGSPGRPKNTGRSGLSNIPARWLALPRPRKRAPRPPFMARHPGSTLDDNHRTCRAPTDVLRCNRVAALPGAAGSRERLPERRAWPRPGSRPSAPL